MNGYRRDTLLDASQQHNGVIEQEGAFGTLLLETNTIYEPLMSGSNAISGITIVGAILALQLGQGEYSHWIGFTALVLASINVVGGYAVTDRMLEMFKKKGDKKG